MASVLVKRNMRLFGLPYQFHPSVDPIVETVSKTIGRKFAENIILDAPVITIIPGEPKYLPASTDKYTTSQALLAAASDNLDSLKEVIRGSANSNEIFKYYDFKSNYTEYMKYVNILCRTCASFLEIEEKIDGYSCQRYDYSKYKWSTESALGNSSVKKIVNSIGGNSTAMKNYITSNTVTPDKAIAVSFGDTSVSAKPTSAKLLYESGSEDSTVDEVEEILRNYNYVQFFIDTDASASESMSNSTSESKIKGMLDQGSDLLKEAQFIMQSGGIGTDALKELGSSVTEGLADITGGSDTSALGGVLQRVLTLSDNVINGENIIMPDIYQNSAYEKSYSFTVHLKTPYGTKFGYFMDICVPLMHLLCLGLPKQTTANTYGSPFLVKAHVEGIFTCNMGMVTGISVSKGVNSAYSVDGLPTEVDVTVTIADLYSDLSMSPQNAPLLFVNNSSLIEYLATTCGLSLVTPNIEARFNMIVNAVTNAFMDIPSTVISGITEAMDGLILDFFGLSW